MRQPIFLIGYMAAGKSTLGRYAARLLGREYVDLDRYIEARYRHTIPELFATRGEDGFREIERNMLHEVGEFDNLLIATGGGTPCFYDNIDYMNRQGIVVFLSCTVDTICRRLSMSKNPRPLVIGKSTHELHEYVATMLSQRMPFYKQASYTFDANEYEHQEALSQAVELLRQIVE